MFFLFLAVLASTRPLMTQTHRAHFTAEMRVLVALFALFVCAQASPGAQPQMMHAYLLYLKGFATLNITTLTAGYADDAVVTDPVGTPTVTSKQQYQQVLSGLFAPLQSFE